MGRDRVNWLRGFRFGLRGRLVVLGLSVLAVVLSVCQLSAYRMSRIALEEQYRLALSSYGARLGTVLDILGLDVTDLDRESVVRFRSLFEDPILGDGSYPMVILPTGEILFHFFREGEYFPLEIVEQMSLSRGRRGEFHYHFGGGEPRRVRYSYDASLGCFLAVESSPGSTGVDRSLNRLGSALLLLGLGGLVLGYFVFSYFGRHLRVFFQDQVERMRSLSRGEIPGAVEYSGGVPELLALSEYSNRYYAGLEALVGYVDRLRGGDLGVEYARRGPQDGLGSSLELLQRSLVESAAAESERRSLDAQRNWVNAGVAEVSRLLREEVGGESELGYRVVAYLVGYLGAVQGALYLYADGSEDGSVELGSSERCLRLVAAHAYDHRRYQTLEVEVGEGLVGECARDRQTLHLDRIPDDYYWLYSGVGQSFPRELLLVPLEHEGSLMGVLELGMLEPLASYRVGFVEALSSSLAQSFLSARTTLRLQRLVEESKERRGQLDEQEEELLQNMEELRATEERIANQNLDYMLLRSAVDESSLYGEFDPSGVVLSLNGPFRTAFGVSGRVGSSSVDGLLIQRGCRVSLSGVVEPVSLSAVWDRVSEGREVLHGVFEWSLDGVRVRALGSLGMQSEDTVHLGRSPRVYFLGQPMDGFV